MSEMPVLILGLEIKFQNTMTTLQSMDVRIAVLCTFPCFCSIGLCSLEVYLCGNLVRLILLLGIGFASLLHSSPVFLEGPFQWYFCAI